MNENPVNNPNKPPQLAKKSVWPYSSFLSDVINCISLKNITTLAKYSLKQNSI